jgi:sugar phosphate isomerase/epimerase
MQEPLETYCHVGIVHPMIFPECGKGDGPIVETISRIAADDFFSAIEITRINDAAVRAKVADVLTTAGLDVVFAAQPAQLASGLSLCDLDSAKRRKAVEFGKTLIDQAYELGAAIMAVMSGPDPGEAARPKATDALVESLKQLCGYAQEKAGEKMLSISLENFDRDIDKRQLIGPTEEAAKVAETVWDEASNFGLTIDLSHAPLLHERVHDIALNAVDHLIHVHIGNCVMGDPGHPAYGDQHPRFGLEGGAVGVEELRRFLEALVYAGYFKRNTPTTMPVISFEVKPVAGESPELVIANAKRTLKQAWARL